MRKLQTAACTGNISKKIIYPIIFSVMLFAGCAKNTIKLPSAEDISEINITMLDGTKIRYTDGKDIEQVMSLLSAGTKTSRKSVQDNPSADQYGRIDIENKGGTTTAFFYKEKGKYFIEQPYTGIYAVDADLENSFAEIEG